MTRMRMIGVALLATAALAGCDRGPPGGQATLQTAQDREAVMRQRWSAMFDDPRAVVAAANEFGFASSGYAAVPGGGYKASGSEVRPDAQAPLRIEARFEAAGQARRVERIRFAFTTFESRGPTTKKERDLEKLPRRVVQGFLSRFGLGASDPVISVLQRGGNVDATLDGGRIVVATRTPSPARREMDVTVTPR